jgi:CBS domain-containing protein
MTVGRFVSDLRGPIVQVCTSDSVADVVKILAERRIGCVPVVDDGAVVGIFSERDLVYGVARSGPSLLSQPVSAVMTSPPVTVTADVPIISALSLMTRRRIRHLPVMEGARMVAFVSIGDLIKWRIDQIETEASAMRDYIQAV